MSLGVVLESERRKTLTLAPRSRSLRMFRSMCSISCSAVYLVRTRRWWHSEPPRGVEIATDLDPPPLGLSRKPILRLAGALRITWRAPGLASHAPSVAVRRRASVQHDAGWAG